VTGIEHLPPKGDEKEVGVAEDDDVAKNAEKTRVEKIGRGGSHRG
jgi:hypothetical protein